MKRGLWIGQGSNICQNVPTVLFGENFFPGRHPGTLPPVRNFVKKLLIGLCRHDFGIREVGKMRTEAETVSLWTVARDTVFIIDRFTTLGIPAGFRKDVLGQNKESEYRSYQQTDRPVHGVPCCAVQKFPKGMWTHELSIVLTPPTVKARPGAMALTGWGDFDRVRTRCDLKRIGSPRWPNQSSIN